MGPTDDVEDRNWKPKYPKTKLKTDLRLRGSDGEEEQRVDNWSNWKIGLSFGQN